MADKDYWWTPERLQRAHYVISTSINYPRALSRLAQEFGRPITQDSMLRAFRRNGYAEKPRELLGSGLVTPEGDPVGSSVPKPPPIVPQMAADTEPEAPPPSPRIRRKRPQKDRSRPVVHLLEDEDRVKVLTLSDLHIPYQADWAIQAALDADGDADFLVLNGDNLEIEQLCFAGRRSSGNLEEEYDKLVERVMEWCSRFRRVYLTWGNHEYRLLRYLTKNVDVQLHWLIDGKLDILGRLDYDIFGDKPGNLYYSDGPEGWYCRLGDCVFAHPRNYSKVRGKTAKNAFRHFKTKDESVGAVVIGHTHSLYRGVTEVMHPGGVDTRELAIESGCLLEQMDYSKEGKLGLPSWDLGYAVVTIENGKTVYRKSKAISLG